MSIHIDSQLSGTPVRYPWGNASPSRFLERVQVVDSPEWDRRDELRALVRDRIQSYRKRHVEWSRKLDLIGEWEIAHIDRQRLSVAMYKDEYPWGGKVSAVTSKTRILRAIERSKNRIAREFERYRKVVNRTCRLLSLTSEGRDYLRRKGYRFALASTDYHLDKAEREGLGFDPVIESAAITDDLDVARNCRNVKGLRVRRAVADGLLAGSNLTSDRIYEVMARSLHPGEAERMALHNLTVGKDRSEKKYNFKRSWFDCNRDLTGAFSKNNAIRDLLQENEPMSRMVRTDYDIRTKELRSFFGLSEDQVDLSHQGQRSSKNVVQYDVRAVKPKLFSFEAKYSRYDYENIPRSHGEFDNVITFIRGGYSFSVQGPAGSGKTLCVLASCSNLQMAKLSFRIYSGTRESLEKIYDDAVKYKMGLRRMDDHLYWSEDGSYPEKDFVCFVDEAGIADVSDLYRDPALQLIAFGDLRQITVENSLLNWMDERGFHIEWLRVNRRAADASILAWSNIFAYDMNMISRNVGGKNLMNGLYLPLSISKRNAYGNCAPEEAKAVADMVKIRSKYSKSVGVVCFNAAQKYEILKHLGEFKPAFIGTPKEVQGLEADDVVVSMTLAMNRFKRIPRSMKWLNGEEGLNAVNVAMTRARVFTFICFSLLPEDFEFVTMSDAHANYYSVLRACEANKIVIPVYNEIKERDLK
jgi:hypothetical protein